MEMLSHHSLHEPGLCTYFTGPACSARHKVFLWIPKHFLYNKSNTSSLLPTFCWSGAEKQQLLAGIYPFTGNQGRLYTHCRHSSSHLLVPEQCTGQQRMHLSLHWVKLNAQQRQSVHLPSAIKAGTIWEGQILQHALSFIHDEGLE